MTLFGIRIRLHILSPLMLILLFVFSGARNAFPMLASLSVHELSHLLAALFLKARVDEIELMPYGAAIRLYGLWETHPFRLLVISAAGPLSNLLLAAVCALLITLMPFSYPALMPLTEASLLLAFVNLLPALPLDGGRCLCALLSLKMKQSRAVAIGIFLGVLSAISILISSVYALLKTGSFPLLPALCAVYILASGAQERRQSEGAILRAKLLKSSNLLPRRCVLICLDRATSVFEALKNTQPGEDALYAVTDESGTVLSLLSDTKVKNALLQNAALEIGSVK